MLKYVFGEPPNREIYNPLHDELAQTIDDEDIDLKKHVDRCSLRYGTLAANQIENRNIQRSLLYKIDINTKLVVGIGMFLLLKGVISIEEIKHLIGF